MSTLLRSTASLNWRVIPDTPSQTRRYFPRVRTVNITLQFVRPDARRIWSQSSVIGSGQFIFGQPFGLRTRAGNPTGSLKRYSFTGFTRDSAAAILPSAVVKLFHTSDNTFQEQATSDVNGAYVLSSPYNDSHYIVAYKAGAPDVAGTTVNTLVGS